MVDLGSVVPPGDWAIIGSILGGVLVSLRSNGKVKKQLDEEVMPTVQRVENLSSPTSGTFVTDLNTSLADITRRLDRIETSVTDHLHTHILSELQEFSANNKVVPKEDGQSV